MSLPGIFLASILPLLGIVYLAKRGYHREMREELRIRRLFLTSIGLTIMILGEYYKRLGLERLYRGSIAYGFSTFIIGLTTMLGHKASVHVFARSASGAIELAISPIIGLTFLAIALISGVSRLKTGAHTIPQVVSGFLIGLIGFIVVMR